MKSQRGDIVLVNYPFSEGQGAKIRPALVVQCDINNRRLESTLIAQITSRTQLARKEPTQLLIEVLTPTGQQSGLINDSAVACENIYTASRVNNILCQGTPVGCKASQPVPTSVENSLSQIFVTEGTGQRHLAGAATNLSARHWFSSREIHHAEVCKALVPSSAWRVVRHTGWEANQSGF